MLWVTPSLRCGPSSGRLHPMGEMAARRRPPSLPYPSSRRCSTSSAWLRRWAHLAGLPVAPWPAVVFPCPWGNSGMLFASVTTGSHPDCHHCAAVGASLISAMPYPALQGGFPFCAIMRLVTPLPSCSRESPTTSRLSLICCL